MRDILWEGSEDGKKVHLVSWEVVKRERSLVLVNIVLPCLGSGYGGFLGTGRLYGIMLFKNKYEIHHANGWDSHVVNWENSRSPWNSIFQGTSFLSCLPC